jgi:hypothetical protein
MAAAGDYAERMDWQRRTPGTPDSYGQRADSFASLGDLWVRGPGSERRPGGREGVRAPGRHGHDPGEAVPGAASPMDRLRSHKWGDVWTVEHVVRGVNEMVLEVTRPRWTAGGGTAG